jgi:hypothetical protein
MPVFALYVLNPVVPLRKAAEAPISLAILTNVAIKPTGLVALKSAAAPGLGAVAVGSTSSNKKTEYAPGVHPAGSSPPARATISS